jgi:hypothetical protein
VAISFIGTPTTGSITGSTTQNWELPSGWVVGDVGLFYYYCGRGTGTFSPNAGVTEIINHADTDASNPRGRLYIGYRVLQSGDTTFSWTSGSVASIDQGWGVEVYRGVDTADPVDATSGASPTNFTDTNDPTAASVTPASDNTMVIAVFGKANDYTSITLPGSYTAGFSLSYNIGSDISMSVCHTLLVGGNGTPQSPGTWVLGGGSDGDDGLVWSFTLTEAAATGRTTKNTRSFPHASALGSSFGFTKV